MSALALNSLQTGEVLQVLTDGATVNWDMSLGRHARLTLGGNRVIANPTNMVVGTVALEIAQDATGSRAPTWGNLFQWPLGNIPVLSTQSGVTDALLFFCDGTNMEYISISKYMSATVVFTNSTVVGLKAWYKADTLGLTDGAAVGSWTDQSGNSNTASQATTANKPVFKVNSLGFNAVRFTSGNASFMTMTADPTPASTASVFVVIGLTIASGSQSPYGTICGSTGMRLLARVNNTSNWGTFAGADLDAGESLSASVLNILEMTTSTVNNNVFLYRNGTQKATATGQSSTITASIGYESGSGSRYLSGDIMEILIYNTLVTAPDRLVIERYLGTKYGITVP